MIGTIIGDIAGSIYESSPRFPKRPVKTKNFNLFYANSRFTDDTVLTCATFDAILEVINQPDLQYPCFWQFYRKWGIKYPDRGYGSGFREWLKSPHGTVNNSYANGAMMRCSPIGYLYEDFEEAMYIAKMSVQDTHNSQESIRGVQSIVSAIWMAKNEMSKLEIRSYVEENFGHMLNLTLEEVKNIPKTSIRCNITAPQALICFMESIDFESAIRNAIYIGGDTDTNAAIAGSIAEAFYGVKSIPQNLIKKTKMRLNPEIIDLVNKFYYHVGSGNEKYGGFQI